MKVTFDLKTQLRSCLVWHRQMQARDGVAPTSVASLAVAPDLGLAAPNVDVRIMQVRHACCCTWYRAGVGLWARVGVDVRIMWVRHACCSSSC